MFKLYKRLSGLDYFLLFLILGFTILQVYCTMTMTDYVSGIISAITYLNYHNNPAAMGEEVLKLVNSFGGLEAIGNLGLEGATGLLGPEVGPMLYKVAVASINDIWWNGGMIVLMAVSIAAVQALISVLASKIAADQATNLRTELTRKCASFSLAETNAFSTASLITRTTNDIQQVQIANIMLIRMILAAPITAIWAVVKIQASSLELTFATAVAIAVLLVFVIAIMLLVMPRFKLMQKLIDRLNGVTRENLTGIRVVHAYNAEEYQEEKSLKANEALTKANLFTGEVMALMSPAMSLVMNGLTLAIYWIGALLINQGTIDYATVTAFMMLGSQIIMSFMMLLMLFVLWPRAEVSAKRINEVLEAESSILDPVRETLPKEKGTVEFKDVSFRYPDAAEYVLEHISFKAKQGDTVAFIGPTGSGKSSLVNLAFRLYDVTDGEVLVDGVNVKDMKQSTLRGLFGYVPQKGFLFKGTVRENVGLGQERPLNDGECQRALDISGSDFIKDMEGGLEAQIVQGGKNVSGGQKQRLCIARAVALHPEIYVFDDSFSALDFKTDRMVRENLAREEKEATKLIVAQRIGTIMDADTIVVLKEGKAVGVGTHKELLQNCPLYREIALSQLSKEELGL